jgi:hypothetical protein
MRAMFSQELNPLLYMKKERKTFSGCNVAILQHVKVKFVPVLD